MLTHRKKKTFYCGPTINEISIYFYRISIVNYENQWMFIHYLVTLVHYEWQEKLEKGDENGNGVRSSEWMPLSLKFEPLL